MCGILGTLGVQNSNEDLLNSLKLISHRGPDNIGWHKDDDDNLFLGHTRLSILDLTAKANQPFKSVDDRYLITYNGEIYNFKELREGLIDKGYEFNTNTDTEVIVNLFYDQGYRMLDQLDGIFAFAIWDTIKKELFLARDSFGIKPLFYVSDKSGFAFASEMKCLTKLINQPIKPNYEILADYLTFHYSSREETLVCGINKFPPGAYMFVQKDGIIKRGKWYNSPYKKNKKFKTYFDKSDSISGTEKYLRQAVHKQMISDVPVGCFLSGGLDSSSIAKFASEINPNLECFTINTNGVVEDGMADDLPYARQIAKHLNVPLNIVDVTAKDVMNNFELMIKKLDEPLPDFSALNTYYISKYARDKGIKVLLSGTGGDDIFSGYRRHAAINFDYIWNWAPKNFLRLLSDYLSSRNLNNGLNRKLAKLFDGAGLGLNERIINYFIWLNKNKLDQILGKEVYEVIKNYDPRSSMRDTLEEYGDSIDPLSKMLIIEQNYFLPDLNLNYVDRMTMANGVETRVPFLDKDLLLFSSRINPKYKQKGTTSKWVLKKAMERHLPKSTIYRTKTGFGVPFRKWLKTDLRDMVNDLLSDSNIKQRGIFSSDGIQKLIKDNYDGKIDAGYTILNLMCIELWLRNNSVNGKQ